MWASILRSACNFSEAQQIRNRHKEILAGEERIPGKEGSFYGDPDNLPWNEIMRDEFDNTAELLNLIENGGQELISTVDDPAKEDIFLLGPDIVGALKKKMMIMRQHWRDVEKYLAPPLK